MVTLDISNISLIGNSRIVDELNYDKENLKVKASTLIQSMTDEQ